MIVLVSGSRYFRDQSVVWGKLDEVCGPGPHTVIHGAATGVDHLAETWAKSKSYNYRGYPAKWTTYGRSAGPIRNQEMLGAEPDIDIVLAFPAANSKGTWDMVRRAENIDLPVVVIAV